MPRLISFTLILLAKAQQTNRSTNGTNVSSQNDCAKRPGLPPDFPALYEELNNGSYSEPLYGARHKLPRCSQLRLLWLPLMDNATLRTIHLCGDKGMVPRPIPPRLLYFPFTYEYKDSAMVPALLGNAPDLRDPPLEPWGLPSNAWVEVTHCPAGACVKIKFLTPHAIDATSSSQPHLLDGVETPRHRRDVVPVTAAARWRGGSRRFWQ